ncbi:trans-sialidase, putative, partial [Trypanosoma cruzi marinkellei]
VTGSSGRREGRESERQRPNMSRHLFYSPVLLLLVVMMCCNTCRGAAEAAEVPPAGQEASKTTYFVWRDVKKEGEKVESLHVPSLVEMNGKVFAVAEADCKKNKEGYNDYFPCIASEPLKWTDGQSKVVLDTTQVRTQILVECLSGEENCASREDNNPVSQENRVVDVSRPTTVVSGSDIYMLAGTYVREGTANEQVSAMARRGLLLSRGNVSGEESNKRIYWYFIDSLQSTSNTEGRESFTELTGGGGSGVNMKDGTLVFPVEGTKKENDDTEEGGKTVSLILFSKGPNSWTLSNGTSADGCSDPSVVEWEKDKKLIMMTACNDGRRRVYESGDMGDSWTEALGTLSRVWGKKEKGRDKGVGSGFITATIEDRDVMLVTLPVYANENENKKGKLHLWLTDNTHIVDIGPVSREGDDAAASSLLYKHVGDNEELIALYGTKGS